jgi:hypothetical protein
MGIRTRGLDIKAGAAKLKADRAARLEAELLGLRLLLVSGVGADTEAAGAVCAAAGAGRRRLRVRDALRLPRLKKNPKPHSRRLVAG